MQGLRSSRSLAKGEMDLRVGNGARVVAIAVGVYDLTLPSGFVFQLKNCYYVPTVSKNIISVSCLDVDGFHFIIVKPEKILIFRKKVKWSFRYKSEIFLDLG